MGYKLKRIYLWTGDITDMRGPCSEGFHVPKWSEFDDIKTMLGVLGLSTGDNASMYLKLPFAGYRSDSSGNVSSKSTYGYYWCCDNPGDYGDTVNARRGCSLYLSSSSFAIAKDVRAQGNAIRPFKDTPIAPDSNWVVLYQGTGTAGIYHNSTLGLISISSDGTNRVTISDKNLGATTVYNYGDTLSEANCGKYYQWGNNYGFLFTGSITTSSTIVDASTYGPGNYYSSSTFIVYGGDWSSVQNDNLRGGVTGPMKEHLVYPKIPNYLCFTANTAGSTISLTKIGSPTSVTLETSTNGLDWTTYTFGTTITLSNIGDKVYWRNTSTTDTGFSTSATKYYKFVMSGSIAGSGDINYLLNKNSTMSVSGYCYNDLFYQCTSLTTPPELPATTLGAYCYQAMFDHCTGLTTAPKLPATNLATYCYQVMFSNCSNLETLPKLPATTLQQQCYFQMFYYCSKIKISSTQTGAYQTAYRIPTTGSGTTASNALANMFTYTGGTFKSSPSINTTYYTSNTLV